MQIFGFSIGSRAPRVSGAGGYAEAEQTEAATPPGSPTSVRKLHRLKMKLEEMRNGPIKDYDHMILRMAELERYQRIEEEEKKGYEKTKVDVEEDSYTFLLMRLVQNWDGLASATFWMQHGEYKGRFRLLPRAALFHAWALYLLGAGIQVTITMLLLINSIDLTMKWRRFDFNGSGLHAAARLIRDEVSDGSLPSALITECQGTRQVKQQACYIFVMVIWMARMVPEFRNAYRIGRHIMALEHRHDDKRLPMLDFDGTTVLRLDSQLRLGLLVAIPLIRILVAVLVTYAGVEFLVVQEKTGDIVVKALCMQFVTDIDNMMLRAFSSDGARQQLKQTKLFVNMDRVPLWNIDPDLWSSGVGGLTYIAVTAIAIALLTGCCGLVGEFGDIGSVKVNMMYFRWQCQRYCIAWPGQCGEL